MTLTMEETFANFERIQQNFVLMVVAKMESVSLEIASVILVIVGVIVAVSNVPLCTVEEIASCADIQI